MDYIVDTNLAVYLPLHERDGSSFMSGDAYGHLCTVTGASWRPDGHYFDGVDDFISMPNPKLDMSSKGFTMICEFKTGKLTGAQQLADIRAANDSGEFALLISGSNIILYFLRNIASTYRGHQADTAITADTWYTIACTWAGGNISVTPRIFLNGIEDTVSASGSGGVDGPTENTTNDLRLGLKVTEGDDYLGTIRKLIIYRRVLTPQEIQHNYLASKWRYQ